MNQLVRIFSMHALCCATLISQPKQWESLNGPTGGSVRSIASDKKGNLYAASWNALFKSIDNGNHWVKSCTLPTGFKFLRVNSRGEIYCLMDGYLYFSSDEGTMWSTFIPPNKSDIIQDFIIDRHDDLYIVFNQSSVYRSTDKAQNWERIGPYLTGWELGRTIAIDSNEVMYFGSTKNLYRTSQSKISWIKVPDFSGIEIYSAMADPAGRMWVSSVNGTFHRRDTLSTWTRPCGGVSDRFQWNSIGHIFAISGFSTDGGLSWSDNIPRSVIDVQYSLHITRSDHVFIGTQAHGMLRSTDDGLSWQEMTFPNSSVTSLIHDNGNRIYAATYNSGVFSVNDGGSQWGYTGLDWHDLTKIISLEDGRLLASGEHTGRTDTSPDVYLSSDSGKKWIWFFRTGISGYARINDIAHHPMLGFYIATSRGIQYSIDGISFSPFSTGSPVNSICISGKKSVVAACEGAGLWRTTDKGATWNRLSFPFPDSVFTLLRWNPVTNTLFATSKTALFRSADDGDSWVQCTATNSPFVDITFNGLGQMFATDKTWIHSSASNGDTWTVDTTLKTLSPIISLVCDRTGYLYAGTDGEGVFRRKQSILHAPAEIGIGSFQLIQNFPNPFAQSTTITYRLPKLGHVRLEVFDMLGRKVATLVDETKEAGEQSIRHKATPIPGVYLLVLSTNDQHVVSRMIQTP